jgi:hypothetical protein
MVCACSASKGNKPFIFSVCTPFISRIVRCTWPVSVHTRNKKSGMHYDMRGRYSVYFAFLVQKCKYWRGVCTCSLWGEIASLQCRALFVSSREEHTLQNKFHRFTSTKVQILTQKAAESLTARAVLPRCMCKIRCIHARVLILNLRIFRDTRCLKPITSSLRPHTIAQSCIHSYHRAAHASNLRAHTIVA